MTRGKWVALVVGLAAVVLLAPFSPALWRAAMYTPERETPVVYLVPDNLIEENFEFGYAAVSEKRHRWLPGPDYVVQCKWCADSDHRACPRNLLMSTGDNNVGDSFISVAPPMERYTCDCPHPSHAQESE